MRKVNIVLIGYRGTGKTFVGRALAERLGREFVDTDDLIIERAGKSIPKIFEENGEEEFREIERRVVKEVSEKDNLVVGCGGGVAVDEENIENLKKNGVIILLEASAEKIYERIKDDSNRPSLIGKGKFEEIKELLKYRKPFYEKAAEHRIDSEKFTIEENVEQIINYLKEKGV